MSGIANEREDASVLSASVASIVTSHVAPFAHTWTPNLEDIQSAIDADAEAWLVEQAAIAAVPTAVDAPVASDLLDTPAPFAPATYGFTDDPAVEEQFDIPATLPEDYVVEVPEDAAELDEQLPAPELPPVPEALLTEYQVAEDEDYEAEEPAEVASSDNEGTTLPDVPDALTRDYDVEEEAESEALPATDAESATEDAPALPEVPEDLTRDYNLPEDEDSADAATSASESTDAEGETLPEAHDDLTREYHLPEDEESEEAVAAEKEDDFVFEEEEVEEGPALPEVPEDILTSVDGDAQPRPEWNPSEGSSTLGSLPPVPDFLSPEYSGSYLAPGDDVPEVVAPSDEAPSLLAGLSIPPPAEDNPYVPSADELAQSLAKFDPAAALRGTNPLGTPSIDDPNSDLPAGPALKPARSLTDEAVDEQPVYSLDDEDPSTVTDYTASFNAGGNGLIAGLNDLTDVTGTEEPENPFLDSEPDLTGFEPSRYFGLQNEYDPFNDALPQDEQSRTLQGDMPAPTPTSPDDVDVAPIVDQAQGNEAPRDSRAIMKMLRELNSLREA